MMHFLGFGLTAIVLIGVAAVVLNLEVGTDTVVQVYYTHEPLMSRAEQKHASGAE